MTVRHASLPLALLLAAGCASAGAPESGRSTDSDVDIYNPSAAEPVQIRNQSSVSSHTYTAPLDAVWQALQDVYEELEIPLTTIQPSEGLLANGGFRVRRIADREMSHYLDCGTSMSGPQADQGDVTLSLYTSLDPHQGGTRVTTDLDAFVRLRTSRSTLHCVSRGRLEGLMRDRLQVRLDAAPGDG